MKNKDSSSYFKYHDVYNARFKRENFTDCKNTLDLLKVKWNDGNLKDYKVLAKVTAEKSIEKKIREFSPFFKGRTNESYCSQTYRSQVFDTSQELKPSRSNNHVSQSNKGVTMKDIVNPTVIRVNKTRNKSSNTERVMENKKSTPYYDECNSESFIKVDECTRKIKKETSPLRNTSYSFTSSNNDQTSCAKNQSLLRKYKNVPKHYENEYIKQSKLTQEQENQRERAHLSSRSFNYSQAELEKERLQELNSSESFYFHKLFRDPLYESAKTKVNGLYNMKNKSRADSTYKSRVDEYYLNISE